MDNPRPSMGRIVHYRSRTGDYSVPAIITCTVDTIFQPGVDAGHVEPLTGERNVHLTVFTPGKPGMRRDASDFKVKSDIPISENVSGCYQEWDVAQSDPAGEHQPGTWIWPPRV